MTTSAYENSVLKLWRAVLDQARRDLMWKPVTMQNQSLYRLKCNARQTTAWWLGSQDFYEVCRHAEVDPELTLTEFKRCLQETS